MTPNIHMQSETPQHILCKRGAGIIALLSKSYPPKKYLNTPKHRNSSFFSKTVKTGSHQVQHYPVCQKQYPIITHENHNKRSCYTAVFCATPTQGAVTRTTITTTATTIITNVFQVIRGFPLIIPETYPLPAEQHTQGLTAIFNK